MRLLMWALLACVPLPVGAQQPEAVRSSVYALLQARTELELADSTYSRTRQLHTRRMVSDAELERHRADRERAAIVVVERWIEAVGATPRLRVHTAVKARSSRGEAIARLRISIGDEAGALTPLDSLPADVRRRVHAAGPTHAYVSLKDEPGTVGAAIGLPYEQKVSIGDPSRIHEIEFRLLREADAVVVSLASGGRMDERKVLLEADVSGAISLQAMPFSQDVDLGADGEYEITVERLGDDRSPLRLMLRGLPESIEHYFTDAASGARIGQLQFAPGEQRRIVRLTLTIPTVERGGPAPDSTYPFVVLAVAESGASKSSGDGAADWRARGAGVAELEVTPRGVGRAELRAFNLFHEAAEGERVSLAVIVRNAGSRTLDQVRVTSELPPGWSASVAPAEVNDLAPGAERNVAVSLTPPTHVERGDYEVRLRLEGASGRTRLPAEPTLLRVRLRGRSSGVTLLLLLAVLAAAAAATVMSIRRLARR